MELNFNSLIYVQQKVYGRERVVKRLQLSTFHQCYFPVGNSCSKLSFQDPKLLSSNVAVQQPHLQLTPYRFLFNIQCQVWFLKG